MFYVEFNIRLFLFLLFKKMDILCAIDLDTIIPCYYISCIKNIPRVYDAHELFSEMKEIVTRPGIQQFWLAVERKYTPRFRLGYTVSQSIATEFNKRYGVDYAVIRNLPLKTDDVSVTPSRVIIYQGAVNEARGFEQLIPAMRDIPICLYIYGDGNFYPQVGALIKQYNVADKVKLMGKKKPEELSAITASAYIGVNLVENTGLNQYYSLANKFFDYINAGVPQISMRFPEYENINKIFEVAVLIDDITVEAIVNAFNQLSRQDVYDRLKANCLKAREVYNWQNEENKLVGFYKNLA
jgi:glycosyltransferase involved in cell wall biosynthesis